MENISGLKTFWEADKFRNIKPITKKFGEFPEGFDPRVVLKNMVSELHYKSIVELGCGYGRLCRAFSAAKYTGTDISDYAIKSAKEKNKDYWFQNYSHPIADVYLAYTVFLHLTESQVRDELNQITCNHFIIAEILGREWANNGKHSKKGVPTYNRNKEDYDKILLESGFTFIKEIKKPYMRYDIMPEYKSRNTKISFLLYGRS